MSEKLFVVVDPSDSRHVALERAIETASLRTSWPKIKVFVAVDGSGRDTRAINDNLFRDERWFSTEIIDKLEQADLQACIEVCWSHEWQKSIITSAKLFSADRIYLPVHEKTNANRFSFSDSKWDLLKTAECPVVLIQPNAKKQRNTILAAVNFQAVSDEQQQLNRSILRMGRTVAQMYSAEFHVVNAYLNQMNYPDRGQLAIQSDLDAEHIHTEQGYTNEAVAKTANRLNADLVIMGTLGQNGSERNFRGNTASRVIAALSQDVMVVNN